MGTPVIARDLADPLSNQLFRLLVGPCNLLQVAAAITTTTTTTLRPLPASVVDANGLVRYFAFGSNLAKSKMGSRGKNSSALAYERRWPAVAHDQRLAFNMRGFPPLEPAMAGIEPSPGQECPVPTRRGK